tara:strand:+ start:2055 stop:2225 length:171 start_codon:yes stop_codon:yes gene_type:complete
MISNKFLDGLVARDRRAWLRDTSGVTPAYQERLLRRSDRPPYRGFGGMLSKYKKSF